MSSNRTFMELKWFQILSGLRHLPVLIVPLWNWNRGAGSLSRTKFAVLIVPLWNWNNDWHRLLVKYNKVLIVPLWNWNEGHQSHYRKPWRSNRTFMELKLVRHPNRECRKMCSNRTFMELKLFIIMVFFVQKSSNRTFMELK